MYGERRAWRGVFASEAGRVCTGTMFRLALFSQSTRESESIHVPVSSRTHRAGSPAFASRMLVSDMYALEGLRTPSGEALLLAIGVVPRLRQLALIKPGSTDVECSIVFNTDVPRSSLVPRELSQQQHAFVGASDVLPEQLVFMWEGAMSKVDTMMASLMMMQGSGRCGLALASALREVCVCVCVFFFLLWGQRRCCI